MRQEIESPSKSQALSELPPLNVCKLVCRHFTPPPFFKYLFLLTPYRSVDISALDNQVSDFGIFKCLRSLKSLLLSLLQAVTHIGNIIQEDFHGVDESTHKYPTTFSSPLKLPPLSNVLVIASNIYTVQIYNMQNLQQNRYDHRKIPKKIKQLYHDIVKYSDFPCIITTTANKRGWGVEQACQNR